LILIEIFRHNIFQAVFHLERFPVTGLSGNFIGLFKIHGTRISTLMTIDLLYYCYTEVAHNDDLFVDTFHVSGVGDSF
jgi:hypothetical protein